jgi:hypothetical protein
LPATGATQTTSPARTTFWNKSKSMMTELKKYKEYWDKWHKLWQEKYPFDNQKRIYGWKIPKESMGNVEESFRYFPEPYLISSENESIDAIFLNINPGKGGVEQIHCDKNSVLIKLYIEQGHTYSKTISRYLGKEGYVQKQNKKGLFLIDEENKPILEANKTAQWFNNKRLKWTNNLLASEELSDLFDKIEEHNSKSPKGKLNLSNTKSIKSKLGIKDELINDLKIFNEKKPNILCADLIPWHSRKATDILTYIKKNYEPILEKVLVPLIKMASNIEDINLKNKIFVRGVPFRDIVNNIMKNQKHLITDIKHYVVFKKSDVIDEFNCLITTFTSVYSENDKKVIKTKWYVFTAGQSMFLPDLNYKYEVECCDNNSGRKKLRAFLLESNP